jgi:hypothetical protein
LLYIAHIVENATQEDINKAPEEDRDSIPLKKLYESHNYVMRMAYTPEELPTAECNLTTPLHATQQTVFKLRNSDKQTILHSTGDIQEAHGGDAEYILANSTENCPNDFYSLTSTVVNYLSVSGTGGNTENIAAPIFSDWLIGDPKGDVLSEKAPTKGSMSDAEYKEKLDDYNDRLQAAITGFKDMYGYTHDEVTSAIMYDMRRFVTDNPDSPDFNPNHQAKSFEELRMDKFLSLENYEIIKHLCDNGWLQLYDTTAQFYLGTRLDKNGKTIGDTVRYWCFPIAETAKTTINGEKVTLKDCNEPHRVTVSIAEGDHYLNIAPIEYAKKTADMQNGGRMDNFIYSAVALAKDMGITVADCYSEWKKLSETEDTTLLLANRINHPITEMHSLFADMLYDIIIGEKVSDKASDSAMTDEA